MLEVRGIQINSSVRAEPSAEIRTEGLVEGLVVPRTD